MHEILWKCKWNAMHDHIVSKTQHPTQKFHKKLKSFQKPQKFHKNPKPRSKCVKCMKNEGLEKHTKGEILKLGQNPRGWEVLSERRVFGRWKDSLCRERMREMKTDFTLKLFKEIIARWIEDLSSTKSWQIESVKVLSRIYQRQKYLDGSSSYQPNRNFLNGLRIYRKAIETNSN